MLVLSRKENEGIIIGKNIKITVLTIDGDKIKLGIDAPKSMRIFREELVQATSDFNQQALNAPLVSFSFLPKEGGEGAALTPPKSESDAE